MWQNKLKLKLKTWFLETKFIFKLISFKQNLPFFKSIKYWPIILDILFNFVTGNLKHKIINESFFQFFLFFKRFVSFALFLQMFFVFLTTCPLNSLVWNDRNSHLSKFLYEEKTKGEINQSERSVFLQWWEENMRWENERRRRKIVLLSTQF